MTRMQCAVPLPQIEIVVERAQGNTSSARVGGLPLQGIEQVSHEDTKPLLHLLL